MLVLFVEMYLLYLFDLIACGEAKMQNGAIGRRYNATEVVNVAGVRSQRSNKELRYAAVVSIIGQQLVVGGGGEEQ